MRGLRQWSPRLAVGSSRAVSLKQLAQPADLLLACLEVGIAHRFNLLVETAGGARL